MKMQINISELQKITLKEGELLVVKMKEADRITMDRFARYLREMLETKRVLVYSAPEDIEFLKLGLEEALVDEFIEKELSK